jgi:hypothetical protein
MPSEAMRALQIIEQQRVAREKRAEAAAAGVELPQDPPLRQKLGEWSHAVLSRVNEHNIGYLSGMLAGVADSLCNYPPYGLHLRLQQKKNIRPWVNPSFYKPRELFRGVMPYSLIIPVTALVDGISTELTRRFEWPAWATTFLAGSIAALIVSTPTSNIIVAQQNYGLRPMAAVQHIVRKNGMAGFAIGRPLFLAREGIYGYSVFYAKPMVEQWQKRHQTEERHWVLSGLLASLLVGVPATLCSQPFDTVSTYLIAQENPRYGIGRAAREMYAEAGLRRFYTGVWMRGYAVVAGIFVMGTVADCVKARHAVARQASE